MGAKMPTSSTWGQFAFLRWLVVLVFLDRSMSHNLGQSTHKSTICPVSSSIDTYKHGVLSYPMEMYDNATYQQQFRDHKSTFFNCTLFGGRSQTYWDSCSMQTKCPWLAIDSMDKFVVNDNSNGLCTFLSESKNSSRRAEGSVTTTTATTTTTTTTTTANVIILGGSMTRGQNSMGCCCRNDTKCGVHPLCESQDLFSPEDYFTIREGFCTWGGYLMRWMGDAMGLSINAKFHHLAKGGTNSYAMAAMLEGVLLNKGIKRLTSSDLVFIDHSVNDFANQRTKQVEFLVQAVYSLSDGSIPAIVLLDYANTGSDYAEVSQRYGVPLWRFQRQLWTGPDHEHPRLAEHPGFKVEDFNDHFRNDNIGDLGYIEYHNRSFFDWMHPPWPMHLLISDLIAHTLLETAKTIPSTGCIEASLAQASPVYWDKARQQVVLPSSILNESSPFPARLWANSKEHVLFVVDSEIAVGRSPEMLDGSRDSVYAYKDHNDMDQLVAINMTQEWTLTSDHPAKFGWISEHFGSHKVNEAVLSFRRVSRKEDYLFNLTSCTINVRFLRTYRNNGEVKVRWCGSNIGTIQSWWKSDVVKFSSTERESFKVEHPKQRSDCLLEFVHVPKAIQVGAEDVTHKFKVNAVTVYCEANN